MVNTTLTLPSLAIDITQPPIPDESTTRWFNNFTSNSGYDIFTNITSGGAISNQTILQDFFQILVAGNAPPPLAAFSKPSLAINMSDAILHLHKVLKAQVYGYSGAGSLPSTPQTNRPSPARRQTLIANAWCRALRQQGSCRLCW